MNSDNRVLWIVIGLLGGLIVCSIAAMIAYFGFLRPQSAQNIANTETANANITLTSQAVATITQTQLVEATETMTATATQELPSENLPKISANVVTNCRNGPSTNYGLMGKLLPGEESEVQGRNELNTWWYIKNPDIPGGSCWITSEFTTVEGETDELPIITPPPEPPATIQFYASFEHIKNRCDKFRVYFKITNSGETLIHSGTILVLHPKTQQYVTEVPPSNQLFLFTRDDCPPDEDYMDPGDVRYVSAVINPVLLSGQELLAKITLCEQDHLRGSCMDQFVEFVVP